MTSTSHLMLVLSTSGGCVLNTVLRITNSLVSDPMSSASSAYCGSTGAVSVRPSWACNAAAKWNREGEDCAQACAQVTQVLDIPPLVWEAQRKS